MPFSLTQLAAMVRVLRDVFVSLHLQRPLRLPSTQPTPLDWNCLKQVRGGVSGGVKRGVRGECHCIQNCFSWFVVTLFL